MFNDEVRTEAVKEFAKHLVGAIKDKFDEDRKTLARDNTVLVFNKHGLITTSIVVVDDYRVVATDSAKCKFPEITLYQLEWFRAQCKVLVNDYNFTKAELLHDYVDAYKNYWNEIIDEDAKELAESISQGNYAEALSGIPSKLSDARKNKMNSKIDAIMAEFEYKDEKTMMN